MDRHLFIRSSFLRMANLKESKLILFRQQPGTLGKRLLYVSFWCVLMVFISSGMLLAPGDSDVSATIAVRKHWWWIYNIQLSDLKNGKVFAFEAKWVLAILKKKKKNMLPISPIHILMKYFILLIIHDSCQMKISQWDGVGVATEFRGGNQLNLFKSVN